MKRQNNQIIATGDVYKRQFEVQAKRIEDLEKENKNYKKKLYSCCDDESMAFLDPHEMHKKIRTLENRYKIV
jgi:hypothetical protein